MAFIIVYAGNRQSQKSMQHAYKRDAKDLFIGKLAGNVFLMENSALALMYAYKEKLRNPYYVNVYLAEDLIDRQIPEEVRRASGWMIKNKYSKYPKAEKTLAKNGLLSREALKEIALRLEILVRRPFKKPGFSSTEDVGI